MATVIIAVLGYGAGAFALVSASYVLVAIVREIRSGN